MRSYKCLSQQIFSNESCSIEPIRDQDKYAILEIRNEQLYHLRQSEPLTKEKQEHYFETVVSNLFEQEKPNQLLFSFFEDRVFIGYGGLVHINWLDKNAEISFVMKTELEQEHFVKYWSNYLKLIEKVAFGELNFHKIFTYAFDLRPHLYKVLLDCGFNEEARLKEHCYFDNRFLDVVYHAKINRTISCRKANESDMKLYFDWANDATVRENSYQSEPITLQNHKDWFLNKINDQNCQMLVFQNHLNQAIGQVRIQANADQNAVIGISNDVNHRGKGYAAGMIAMATDLFLKEHPHLVVSAYIKTENVASAKVFEKAGFVLDSTINYQGSPSYHYIKKI
jgi:RimJ/RimL family protein N-acetyltransferase